MSPRKQTRELAAFLILLMAAYVLVGTGQRPGADLQLAGKDEFFPAWAEAAKYNRPLWVVDTDSALGRRSLHAKRLTLRDMALVHGHLCDGLATAWVELGVALRALFPDEVADRTDLRAVSKNGPCWADAAAWTTGARVNHGTLVLDDSVGDGFIVQRISTAVAVRVSLKPDVFPAELAELERSIRSRRASGAAVSPEEIDRFEELALKFIRKLLNTPPHEVVLIEKLDDFEFPKTSPNLVAPRSDIVNRDLPRKPRGER